MKPLQGMTVVDLSNHTGGQACAQVLQQAGARAVLVEPPGGVRLRTQAEDQPSRPVAAGAPTYLFQHLNHGKLSVVLDPEDAESVSRCNILIQNADILITSPDTAHEMPALAARTVHCRISDFPADTSLAHWRGSEMIHQALSGTMYVTGDEDARPLFGIGQRAYWAAGFTAAIAVLAALVERHRSGLGQCVETTVFEACAAMAQNLVTQYSYNGTWPTRRAYPGMLSVLQCRDAWVVLFAFGNWPGLCKSFGVPELASDSRFEAVEDRLRLWPLITELLGKGAADLSADEVVAEAQRQKICAEKVATIEDLLESEYFMHGTYPGDEHRTGYDATHSGIGPWLTTDSEEELNRAASDRGVPELGEHADDLTYAMKTYPSPHTQRQAKVDNTGADHAATTDGPLDGIRIVDLTTAWAGPMTTRCLAYLGAEVIKIEAPTRPDLWRSSLGRGAVERFPDMEAGSRPYNRSALFNTQNHDKKSIGVDLKQPAGRDIVERLIARSDLVVSNFSPGVMERLGLGYPHLASINDRIVSVEMPAFRSKSEAGNHVGMGKTMEAASGMGNLIGYGPDSHPVPTGPAYLDPIGGLHGAVAALLGYLRVLRTGRGSHLEVAQTDAATRWIGEYLLEQLSTGTGPTARGNTVRRMAPHDSFPSIGDDEWIAIAVDSDTSWQRLGRVSQ